MTPKEYVESAVARLGSRQVAETCVALLGGSLELQAMSLLGSTPDPRWLEDERNWYWPRVWGARGLLWNWDQAAEPALVQALVDDHWRVREMTAKVVARHLLGDVPVDRLLADGTPRVRAAAERAVQRLIAAQA